MKALLYKDWGALEIAELPAPTPAAGEAVVRVEACGICGSEIECFLKRLPRRQPPLVLGHEFCGRIESVAPGVESLRPGDLVIANSVIPCRKCHACRRGDTNLCPDRRLFGMHRPGACAEFVAAPVSVLYQRPAGMDPILGALVEPASNGVHAANLLPHLPKRSVFVFGAGVIGLMCAQAVRAVHGARVAVADVSPERLDVARELGVELGVNVREQDAVKTGLEFSGADGIDYVIDAVGSAATKAQSLAMLRPGGAACWIGLHEDAVNLATYGITLPQKAVVGSYAATEEEFLFAARLLAEGRMKGGRGIRAFPLADGVAAFHRLARPQGGDLKAVIVP